MANSIDEKELVYRLAESLMNEMKAQLNCGMKAGTNIRPYAERYNLLRERVLALGINDGDKFIPELPKELLTFSLTHVIMYNAGRFDELNFAITQMVAFLQVVQDKPMKILSELENFLYKNLRKNVINRPNEEKDIQNVIEIMLNSKGYAFEREKVRISYSSKTFVPDFTFEDLNAALEIKFCKTDKKEKDLVDEINADILAYSTKYQNLTFLVYDLGIIRDIEQFAKDIEKNSPRIKILIVKQ